MKKFLAIFLIIIAGNISSASAAMLPVAEVGVNEFVHSMAEIVYSEDFQKEKPLLITNAVKIENKDLPEIGEYSWACQYGLKTSSQPEGEIIFFVDGADKVSAVKLVCYSEQYAENAGVLFAVITRVLGIRQADAEFLLSNLNDDEILASSIVWSEERQRCFLLMAGARAQSAEGFQFMLMASDKQN